MALNVSCGCNLVLTYSPTVTCSPKTEAKVTVICSTKIEPKVAKKFKRKLSIPIQIYLSKNDNNQIYQNREMSQDLNASTCSSLVIFILANAKRDVATTYPRFCNAPHRLHVLFVTFAPGTTFTSWSKHHFVVTGKAEQQVRKASHCCTKQQ